MLASIPDLRGLRTLKAIQETGSLADAALRLHLTPSALSHQLRELESAVGLPVLLRKKVVLIKRGLEVTKLSMGPTGVWRTRPRAEDLTDKSLPVVEIVGDLRELRRKKLMNLFNHYLQAPLEEWEEVRPAVKVHRLEELGTWMGEDWKTAGTLIQAMVPFVRLTTKEIMDKLGVTFAPFCDHVLKRCGV